MVNTANKPANTSQPNNLEAFWMPFTPQREFKEDPRMVVEAEGMNYTTDDGRTVLDAVGGLWCTNAGHRHPKIVQAIKDQLDKLDYGHTFQMGHPLAFQASSRLCSMMPGDFNNVFLSNSGSEAVDTALKIALAYHKAKGDGSRVRLIGRERAYHGMGFGGVSVCGIGYMRNTYGPLLPGTDHMPHHYNLEKQAFSRGQPEWGAHIADKLEDMVALHGANNIAAVIVEPIAGATGVLIPPKGYLKRIREITEKHGILLIFDEVITAWGRLGTTTAAEYFDVMPDIITSAKGITNGMMPMGATFVRQHIYDAFMQGPKPTIEFMHGYTYSGHPLACAAAMATMDVYQEEGLFERARDLAPIFEDAIHALKGLPGVRDIRNLGILGAVEMEPGSTPETFGKLAKDVFLDAYFNHNVLIRPVGNIIAFSPPLTITEAEIARVFDATAQAIKAAA